MKVKDLMTKDVTCCKGTDSVQQAAQAMASVNCGSVPVCENDKVVGMITDRDIVINGVAKGNWENLKVSDCMTKKAVCCTPETDAHEASDMMAKNQVRRLPVVDSNGKLTGICSIGDLATIDIHINEAGDALSKISEDAIGNSTYH